MATPRPASSTARAWRSRLGWLALLALALTALLYGRAVARYAHAATAYGARAGCSCHYIEGRPLGDCRKDFEPGMALVTLSADEQARSITARIALMTPTTATFVEGAGCQLEPWPRN
jgi:hypothetical protein